ncbi:restriction endonuclease subunit S [Acidovorax temperans]|uniref:restriction endonuclease subunit S n=1 Tax=Acidovorax temperans TaxID=80878 RepID=UPI0030CF191D
MQGKLVRQDPADEPAGVLLQKIRAEKDRLIAEGKIKRDKPLAEIAEEDKPFELPQGWEWVRLGGVVNASEAGWSPTCIGSPRRPGHWGVLKVSAVSWGSFDPTANKELPSELTPKPEYEVKDGDFLLSRANTAELVARSVVVGVAEPQLMLSDKIIRLSVSSQMNRAFVNMVNNVNYSREHYAANASGTSSSMKNVSREVVLALPVPVPPLAEQSRIVTRVEALMRLCDALEAKGQLEAAHHAQLVSTLLGTLTASTTPEELAANWQRVAPHFDLLLDRPEAIDALEQTLLQLAVRGLLVPQDPTDEPASALLQKIRAEKDRLIATGQIKRDKPLPPITDEEKPFELPVGWEWVRMGAVVNASEAGWSPTCIGSPRRPGLWGVLKVSAVSWGEFDATANKELPSDLVPRPEYEVRDGDFLLSRANTAELVARSVVVEQAEPKLMLSDKIIRLAVSSQMNRSFLNMANNASYAREHYAVNASGTSSSMKNVSREVVVALPVPLPPLAEQSRIVTRVTALRHLCADLRQRLAERQAVQARLAEALVQEVA